MKLELTDSRSSADVGVKSNIRHEGSYTTMATLPLAWCPSTCAMALALDPAGDAEFVAAIDNADDFCLDEEAGFA